MFKTTVNNVQYKIKFHHLDFAKADLLTDMIFISEANKKLCSHKTQCILTSIYDNGDNDTYEISSVGNAYCSNKDMFNRGKGRKLALADAFSASEIDKETRKLIWDEYFKWCKQ